jgi:hypothetical protein
VGLAQVQVRELNQICRIPTLVPVNLVAQVLVQVQFREQNQIYRIPTLVPVNLVVLENRLERMLICKTQILVPASLMDKQAQPAAEMPVNPKGRRMPANHRKPKLNRLPVLAEVRGVVPVGEIVPGCKAI